MEGWQKPVLSLAPIQPVVLGRAYRARASRAALRTATEADPEVPVSGLQLMYEPLYQPLLALRLDAEQLASFHPAGPAGILEGQPPAAVLDVGHLVARALRPTPADLLTCRGKPKKRARLEGVGLALGLNGDSKLFALCPPLPA